MSGNDWNNLGRDVKDIVQHAIDTKDFGRLNRDLGVTLENALDNVAQSLKNAGKTGAQNFRNRTGGYQNYSENYTGNYGENGTENFQNAGRNYTYTQTNTSGSWNTYRQESQGEGWKSYGQQNRSQNRYVYRPYGNYRSGVSSRQLKEAREEFALFVNTGGSKALGIVFMILGISLGAMFGITSGILGLVAMYTETAAREIGICLSIFLPATALSAAMGVGGNNLRKKVKRFRSYVKTLNGKPYASIRELAKSVRKPEKFVVKDVQKMIDKRMFLEGHLDDQGTCLIASDEAYDQYKQMLENAEKIRQQEAESPKNSLSQEARETIEEGNRYIEQIRKSNDAIPGVEISNKIYHLEDVIRRIFQRVEQHPELVDDLHKFMDYYLPTTVKLLNAYEELDKQATQGENIKTAKQEIENTLDTINVAFENLLDSFYQETAWDVSADISVLKTMLEQEGLTGKKDF